MSGTRKTVLLMEDQGSVAAVEKKSLEEYGYSVILARSGERAVEVMAGTGAVDIILMDIDLGAGMDGTEAAQIILKDHDIPLVFVSSHTDPEVVEKTEKITSYGYVVKKSGITVLDASIKMAFKLFEAKRTSKATMEKLEATLEENRNLLGELQHRVKNSFAMISSLIGLASEDADSPGTAAILSLLDARVMSVSELYSLLYASGSFTEVRLEDYCARVADTMAGLSENVSIDTDMDSIVVGVKKAAPIGLILTELVTNAVKYAFPGGRPGTITLSLKKSPGGAILEVRDDGVGLPPGFDPAKSRGMGLSLVRNLLIQIDGNFRMESETGGTRCVVEFNLADDDEI